MDLTQAILQHYNIDPNAAQSAGTLFVSPDGVTLSLNLTVPNAALPDVVARMSAPALVAEPASDQ